MLRTMPQRLFRSFTRSASFLTLLVPLALLGACSDETESSSPPAADAATETQNEAGQDASSDVPQGEDAGIDASADATTDSPVPEDAQQGDAAQDDAAQMEAGQDSEASQDAGVEAADAPVAQLGAVSVAALATELAAKDFLLINVHVPYAGEIPQTDANLTYENVPAIETYIGTDLGKEVVLYCYSNYMSTLAGNQLVAKGYWNIRYLDGGLSAWMNAGQPVEYHDQ